ncbi:MAG: ribonuclease H family protein [Anaerolineales bacterium]|nr:ribonuclease H family protein [Anaerolineales bacterium]
MSPKSKFYVVWKGRKSGIFSTWEACADQVKGFTGAEYKAFASRAAAERAFKGDYSQYAGKPASSGQWLFAPEPPIAESYCVDAACSGRQRMGRLEYRGVHTRTGKEIFRQGPFENGTNNVGEFLALVHALAWLKHKGPALSTVEGIAAPVYSDSETAIVWVKGKKCKTELAPDEQNAPLFELIARAEFWLAENEFQNPVLKWDTEAWGEIPADFNRK